MEIWSSCQFLTGIIVITMLWLTHSHSETYRTPAEFDSVSGMYMPAIASTQNCFKPAQPWCLCISQIDLVSCVFISRRSKALPRKFKRLSTTLASLYALCNRETIHFRKLRHFCNDGMLAGCQRLMSQGTCPR
jgi:hypothetical protein